MKNALALIEPQNEIVVSQNDDLIMVDGFIITNPGPRWTFKTDDDIYELWLGQFDSPNTKAQYQRAYNDFLDFSGSMQLASVELETLQAFRDGLNGSVSTKRVKINAIKSLLSFAHQQGHISHNYGSALKAPQAHQAVHTKVVSRGNVNAIMEVAERKPQDEAIIKALYYTGCRVSELCNTRWADIEYGSDRAYLHIIGKGNKKRVVPLHPKALQAMRKLNRACEYVFSTSKGKQLHRTQINRSIKRIREKAGVDKPISPHWFRHSNATHSIENGAAITTMQKRLGHSDPKTTMIYVHDTDDQQYL